MLGTGAEVFMLNTTAHLTATVSLNSTAKTAPRLSLHYNLALAKVDLALVQSSIGSFNPVGSVTKHTGPPEPAWMYSLA